MKEQAEVARDTKCTTKVLERKNEEVDAMNIEEEDSQSQGAKGGINLATEQGTDGEGTSTKGGNFDLDTNNKGNARKKARKARKQIRQEKWGDKHEREATKTKQRHTSNSSSQWVKNVSGRLISSC